MVQEVNQIHPIIRDAKEMFQETGYSFDGSFGQP